ncbi:MAG: DUF2344 domain-containing protein [Clostridia bacterium]|nr:DUF2344 domain-containing protein [Clostridia bacterium]
MIARVKYSKGEEVKYVGHLDSMRTFVRCIKRTCIPIKYSNGFNPRVQISFALPLGVGVTSDSEYFDLEIEKKMNETLLIGELNSVLPTGFRAQKVTFVEDKKSLMSLVKEAVYEITIESNFEFSKIKDLFAQSEILIEKESKSKKGNQEINLKDYIIDIDFDESESKIIVRSTAGSVNNMNPNFVVQAVQKYVGEVEDFEIHRKELILN